jgi:hypothetical protein
MISCLNPPAPPIPRWTVSTEAALEKHLKDTDS